MRGGERGERERGYIYIYIYRERERERESKTKTWARVGLSPHKQGGEEARERQRQRTQSESVIMLFTTFYVKRATATAVKSKRADIAMISLRSVLNASLLHRCSPCGHNEFSSLG